MNFEYDDGGRASAGFKGTAGDCVVRAVAIAAQLPYQTVYDALSRGCRTQRVTKRSSAMSSARNGVCVRRQWFKDYMQSIGFRWIPTMRIGAGCTVHLHDNELPSGRLVVQLSKHYTAVIDGTIRDTHDPRREIHTCEPDIGQELTPGQWRNINGICAIRRRCVYGYWIL